MARWTLVALVCNLCSVRFHPKAFLTYIYSSGAQNSAVHFISFFRPKARLEGADLSAPTVLARFHEYSLAHMATRGSRYLLWILTRTLFIIILKLPPTRTPLSYKDDESSARGVRFAGSSQRTGSKGSRSTINRCSKWPVAAANQESSSPPWRREQERIVGSRTGFRAGASHWHLAWRREARDRAAACCKRPGRR
jgi:hypothetical protein